MYCELYGHGAKWGKRMLMHRDGMSMEKQREKMLYIHVVLYFHFHASYLICALQCFTDTLAVLDRQSKTSLLAIYHYVATGFDFHCFFWDSNTSLLRIDMFCSP